MYTKDELNRLPLKVYRGPLMSATNWTTSDCRVFCYQTMDGTWKMNFFVAGTFSSGVTSATFTWIGVKLKEGSSTYQPCYAARGDGGVNPIEFLAGPTASYMTYYGGTAHTSMWLKGDVELERKPDWWTE